MSEFNGNTPATSAPTSGGQPPAQVPVNRLEPLPPPPPVKKIDLTTVAMSAPGQLRPVELLQVRELKGWGQPFSVRVDAVVCLVAIPYKPDGEFGDHLHILAGPLQSDPRLRRMAQEVVYVPALSWTSMEVVLRPIKLQGCRPIWEQFQKIAVQQAHLRLHITWEGVRKHVVHRGDLTEQEQSILAGVTWPTYEQILDALSATAYDDLATLAAANANVRAMLGSREVS